MSTYKTQEKFLKNSIRSILDQTYKNIELIVVVDGDKNNLEIVSKYKNDPRLKIIDNKTNFGLPHSLNIAIKSSTGEYIARMDADDISIRTRIEKQVEYLDKNKNIDLIGTYAYKFGEKKGISMFPYTDSESISYQLLFRSILIHPTVMFRKDFFIKNKLEYNEKFEVAQDYELWSRIIQIGNIAVVPFIGIKLRIHKRQASKVKQTMQIENAKKIIINNIKFYLKKDVPTEEEIETFLVLGRKKKLTLQNNLTVLNEISKMKKYKNSRKFNEQLNILYFISVISSKNIKLINKNNIKIIFSRDVFKYIIKKYSISLKCKKEMVSEKNDENNSV